MNPFLCVRFGLICLAGFLINGCVHRWTLDQPTWRRTAFGWQQAPPRGGQSLAAARTELETAQAAGARAIHARFHGDTMQSAPGQDEFIDLAVDQFRLPVTASVHASPSRDPAEFAHSLTPLVARFRGRIQAWELVPTPSGDGGPEQFAALVQAGSRAVRAGDPAAKVVLGTMGTSPESLEALFRDHAIAPAVDLVNLRLGSRLPAEASSGAALTGLSSARRLVRTHGENEPLWLTVPPGLDADALARTAVLALGSGEVESLVWPGSEGPRARPPISDARDQSAGAARDAFAQLARWFVQPYQPMPPRMEVSGAPDDAVQVHGFRLKDGRFIVAAWRDTGSPGAAGDDAARADSLGAEVRVRFSLPGVADVKFSDAAGQPLPATRARWAERWFAVHLTLSLEGDQVVFAEASPAGR